MSLDADTPFPPTPQAASRGVRVDDVIADIVDRAPMP